MKALIIGNANSGWIQTTIQNTMNPKCSEIYILSYENEDYKSWYESRGIRVIIIPRYRVWKLKPWLASVLLKKRLAVLEFDIMIIHSVRKDYLMIAQQLMPQVKRKIAAFWGSDVFRADSKMIKVNKHYLGNYDCINLTTDAMAEKFHEQYGTMFDDKITRARFGLPTLNNLQKFLDAPIPTECFAEIPRDKVVIAVGYNGCPEQQHHAVIETINNLDKTLLSRIHLVLKMTYGGSAEYIASVGEALKNSACTSTLFTDFMSDDDSAVLTCLTDILIHAQTSDAFSAAVLEHIFSGALVFNPTWISYREMEKENYCEVKYHSLEDLENKLCKSIMKKQMLVSTTEREKRRQFIKEIASWENNRQKWEHLYYGG